MLRPKYILVQRDHVTRGIFIISYHWLKWTALAKAARLTAQAVGNPATGQARYGRQREAWQGSRFTWEVDTRCA